MSIFYIFYFIFLIGISILFIYIGILRKNDFEKRVDIFYPYRQLSEKREAYMRKVSKHNRIVFALLLLPFFVLIYALLRDDYQEIKEADASIINHHFLLLLAALLPVLMVYYIIYYVQQRSKKAKRMLLEQMSDTDFELLLKIRDNFSFPYKYDPPFVLCNNHLYIFLFHTIKEIDPTQIISVKWHSTKYGFLVRIKDPKAKVTVFNISKSALPLFLQIVGQYTELKFNY